ncbi:MAG: phosphoribosylglycinamide formyltransferase [Actinobacteria bacterium]|nr:MAG: phosphoribosylglycinamide formyltransferase [Actinomycetota bacterium]
MSAPRKLPIGVLISGSGTNLQVLIDRMNTGELDVDIRVVLCNKADAFGLERARAAGIPAVHVDPAAFSDANSYNHALRVELEAHGCEIVVMAGYMKLLGKAVLDAYPNRVLNIHPALLPSFAGAHGISDAFDYGVKVTGVTVHFANEVFDEGPIIAQEAVRIAEDDTLASLEARIHEVEYRLYPAAIQLLAEERLEIVGRKVRIRE